MTAGSIYVFSAYILSMSETYLQAANAAHHHESIDDHHIPLAERIPVFQDTRIVVGTPRVIQSKRRSRRGAEIILPPKPSAPFSSTGFLEITEANKTANSRALRRLIWAKFLTDMTYVGYFGDNY